MSQRTRLAGVIGIGALAAVGALAWWLTRADDVHDTVIDAARGSNGSTQLDAIEAPVTTRDVVEASAHGSTVRVVAEADGRDDEARVHGTIVLIDEHGKRFEEPNGILDVDVTNPVSRRTVPVDHGRFELAVDSEHRLRFIACILDGWQADIEDNDTAISVPTGDTLTLTAVARPRVTLHVRDAATGRELRDVTVRAFSDYHRRSWYPPDWNRQDILTEHQDSPVTLSLQMTEAGLRSALPRHGFGGIHVHADGYAWTPARVNLDRGGDHEVLLDRGGDVEVRLTVPGGQPIGLALGRGGGEEIAVHVPPGQLISKPFRLPGLRPGPYRLAVDSGNSSSPVLTTAEFDVRAGEVTVVAMTIPDAESERVGAPRSSGVVRVPPEWGIAETTLRFTPLLPELRWRNECSGWTSTTLTSDFAWAAGLCPGSCVFTIEAIGWSTRLDVPDAGLFDHVIEAPAPATVTLRLVDDRTELDVDAHADVSWRGVSGFEPEHLPAPRTRPGGASRSDDGRYTLRAPVGLVDLVVDSSRIIPLRTRVTVTPGANDRVLMVHRTCSLTVSALDGDARIPGSELQDAVITPIEGDGRVVEVQVQNTYVVFRLSEPGRWRVSLPAIAGYRTAELQEVTVDREETTALGVTLERTP